MINNLYLDNTTTEEIIAQSLNFKDETAGRKWCQKVLTMKAHREAELAYLAEQKEKRAKINEFIERESKPARLSRTDAQKERSAKIYANKHGLNLDELLAVQKQLYIDDLKRAEEARQTAQEMDNAFDIVVEEIER